MTDLQETPAVPPADEGADERFGYFVAGGALIVFGWGVAVGLNLLLHAAAAGGSYSLWTIHLSSTLGSYAKATLAFGIVSGIVGVVLLALARGSPRGRFVLPGAPYPWPVGEATTETTSGGTAASGHP
ncbi:MAG: hypothetical protein L3J87_02400 [Thermoplasmata archaeon]|nr:hypothetical protein [Thermoplasmata archaeon]